MSRKRPVTESDQRADENKPSHVYYKGNLAAACAARQSSPRRLIPHRISRSPDREPVFGSPPVSTAPRAHRDLAVTLGTRYMKRNMTEAGVEYLLLDPVIT